MMDVEYIQSPPDIDGNEGLLAILVRQTYSCPGYSFFTEPNLPQQVGFLSHVQGTVIQPHIHRDIRREIYRTTEVIVVRKGRLRVNLYTSLGESVCERTLSEGDMIVLLAGGHGMKCLDDVEMVEVKQGPYNQHLDKVPLTPKIL